MSAQGTTWPARESGAPVCVVPPVARRAPITALGEPSSVELALWARPLLSSLQPPDRSPHSPLGCAIVPFCGETLSPRGRLREPTAVTSLAWSWHTVKHLVFIYCRAVFSPTDRTPRLRTVM